MKNNQIEDKENHIRKTIETYNTTEENTNINQNSIPNLNNNFFNNLNNNMNTNLNNNIYKNPDQELPCSIYKDMSSCSNYLNMLQEANSNLKLENERLKKELKEKNKMIFEFEKVSEEAQNKFKKFEEMMNNKYCNLYNQMQEIGKMFNIPNGSDFAYTIKQNLTLSNNENKEFNDKCRYLEQENFNLRNNIDNINYENNKLKMLCDDLQNQINNLKCNFQRKENEFDIQEQNNLKNICELKNYLEKKENEIICLKNQITILRNQICEIKNNICNNYNENRNMQNIIYSQ